MCISAMLQLLCSKLYDLLLHTRVCLSEIKNLNPNLMITVWVLAQSTSAYGTIENGNHVVGSNPCRVLPRTYTNGRQYFLCMWTKPRCSASVLCTGHLKKLALWFPDKLSTFWYQFNLYQYFSVASQISITNKNIFDIVDRRHTFFSKSINVLFQLTVHWQLDLFPLITRLLLFNG